MYSCTGAVQDIESIAPRQLYTGQSPFTVEHIYNKINGRKIVGKIWNIEQIFSVFSIYYIFFKKKDIQVIKIIFLYKCIVTEILLNLGF